MGLFDSLLKINEDDETWNDKGIQFEKVDKYYEALVCFDKALEINPNSADAWINKGDVLKKIGRHDAALACVDKGLEIEPSSVAWYLKASILEYLGRHEEALSSYNKQIAYQNEINPKSDSEWISKADALEHLGKHKEALVCYNKVHEETLVCYDKMLEINPEYVGVLTNKGSTKISEINDQENILGVIKIIDNELGNLYFTPYRMIFANTSSNFISSPLSIGLLAGFFGFCLIGLKIIGIFFPGGFFIPSIILASILIYRFNSKERADKKSKQLLRLSPDEILHDSHHNFELLFSKITKVEISKSKPNPLMKVLTDNKYKKIGYIDKKACPDYLDIIFTALPEEDVKFI